ncbi:MAG: hypothetical protein AAGE05_02865 [Pseudomonadota bacterium]
MTTDFLATLRELHAYRHRRVVARAGRIVARDGHRYRNIRSHHDADRALDEALDYSFPASDPIALSPRPTAP